MADELTDLRRQCAELLETRGGIFAPDEMRLFAQYAEMMAGTEPFDETDRIVRGIARKMTAVGPRPPEHVETLEYDEAIATAEAAFHEAEERWKALLDAREKVGEQGKLAVARAAAGAGTDAAKTVAIMTATQRAQEKWAVADAEYAAQDEILRLRRGRVLALQLGRDAERARKRARYHSQG